MRALFFVLGMLVAFGIIFWLIREYYELKRKLTDEKGREKSTRKL